MRLSALFLGILVAGCKKDEEGVKPNPPGGALELTSPAAGAWLDAGPTEAEGTIEHISSVTVNGTDATQAGGQFHADLELQRGINVVDAEATDARGDTLFARNGVLAGKFNTPDDAVKDAIRLRLNQGGLDTALDAAADQIDADTLEASLSAINPVYSDSYAWDTVTIAADVTSVDFDRPELSVDPNQGQLELTATLPNVYVTVAAYGSAVGFDFDTDVAVWASEAVVTGTLSVSAEHGRLVVTLDDAAVDLRDFGYDTSLLPGSIEDYILVDTIRDQLESMIVDQIQSQVPALLDETLAGLDPSFSTELLGKQVDLSFSFADAEVDDDGLALSLDLDVAIPTGSNHTYAGYLAAGDGTPSLNTHADLSGAISDDLLNRVLFEAWRGGMLDMTLSTDDGSLPSYMLLPLKAEQGTVSLDAVLPPVVVESDDGLQAQVGELVVTIDTPGGELGEHLVVAVDAWVGLEVTIEDGAIKLALGEPTLTLMVRESDWGADNETITNLVQDMLPLDTLLSLLGDFSFPIPSLYGIGVDSGTVSRDDDTVHTDLNVTLQ